MNKIIQSLLRVTVSVLLIAILLYIMRDKYGEIFGALKKASIPMFGLALLFFIFATFIASYRLKLIIHTQGDIPIKFMDVVSLTFIGYFFNNFLPTSIGGDVVKAYYLSRKTDDKTGSFTSVFVDRAIGLFTMIFMAFIALCFAGTGIVDDPIRYMIYAITVFSIVAITFMTNKKFAKKFSVLLVLVRPMEERLRKVYNAINKYRHHTRLLIESLAISVLSQIMFFASIGMLIFSIGSRISPIDIFLRVPITSAMSLLPSINGLGVREGSTVLLFGPLIGKEKAFVVSILWLLVLLSVSIIGGIIYLVSPQFKIKLKEIAESEE